MRTGVSLILTVVAAMLIALQGGMPSARENREEINPAEANVMEVDFSQAGAATEYRFDVTLYHDDDGEDGYADWWQVEDLDGNILGRRDLHHPHGTREFTRSKTIDIPEGIEHVVVRGHDKTHRFGGRAAIVDLIEKEIKFMNQGDKPWKFIGYTGGAQRPK